MDLSSRIIIKNADLDKDDVRNKILTYLYQRVNAKLGLEPLRKTSQLDKIMETEYLVCPVFKGQRSWMMFYSDGDNYYAINFLKYQKEWHQSNVRIYPVDIGVSKEIYRGTIFEGIFYRLDSSFYFVVDEVYYFAGKSQLLKSKDDRLMYLSSNLNKFMMKNKFRLLISQYYSLDKNDLIDLYDKVKTDNKICDLIFYPKIWGKPIYIYQIMEVDLETDVINMAKFEMYATHHPDVYELRYLGSDQKFDIAYVPDMATSKKCKQWFKKNKKLVVNCRLNLEKNRWIPLDVVESEKN